MLTIILLILLVMLLLGTFPTWPHSRNLGYGPSGFFFVLLVVLLILAATNRITLF